MNIKRAKYHKIPLKLGKEKKKKKSLYFLCFLNYKLHPLSLLNIQFSPLILVKVQFDPLSFDHFNLVLKI